MVATGSEATKVYKLTIKRYEKICHNWTTSQTEPKEVKIVSDEFLNNCIENGALEFFRGLGGTETLIITKTGYRLTSVSPDHMTKIVRTFKKIEGGGA